MHFCCTMQPHFPPQRPSSPSLHPLCNTDLCISHLLLSLTSIKSRNLPLWLLQCLMGSAADTALFECLNGNLTSFVPSMYHPVIVMNRNLNALGKLRGDTVGIPAQEPSSVLAQSLTPELTPSLAATPSRALKVIHHNTAEKKKPKNCIEKLNHVRKIWE